MVYGRSLTYRFAQAAFWSACIYADVPVFSHGIIKGIIVRHFEEWFSHPITDNGGVLTIGYRYTNLHVRKLQFSGVTILEFESIYIACTSGKSSVLASRTVTVPAIRPIPNSIAVGGSADNSA